MVWCFVKKYAVLPCFLAKMLKNAGNPRFLTVFSKKKWALCPILFA